MSRNANYPDVSFVETDTETIVNSMIEAYEIMTNRKLATGDPVRLFILWVADLIIQDRILINESAKQNLPRYAEGENLDSIAEIFRNVERLEATPATTTLRFYISVEQDSAQVIKSGTRVNAGEDIIFETTHTAVINAGETYVDTPAICQTAGVVGNGFAIGEITELIDIYPYYERVENITISEGGAEVETDDAFYERMGTSLETYSTAGAIGSYNYYVKTASSLIVDSVTTSPEPGVIDIRVLLENSTLPDEELLQKVQDTVSANDVRPLGDFVTVNAPNTVGFNVDLTYFIADNSELNPSTIVENVNSAVDEYISWQTSKIARDINPSYLHSLVMGAGVKRVEIREPSYTVIDEISVAVSENVNSLNGGVESE